jgi:hypothetical protein
MDNSKLVYQGGRALLIGQAEHVASFIDVAQTFEKTNWVIIMDYDGMDQVKRLARLAMTNLLYVINPTGVITKLMQDAIDCAKEGGILIKYICDPDENTSNKEYEVRVKYRCRLCGAEFYHPEDSLMLSIRQMKNMSSRVVKAEGYAVQDGDGHAFLTCRMHKCQHGWGFADLLGFEKYEKEGINASNGNV